MKNKLLLFAALILTSASNAQPNLFISAPLNNGGTSAFRAPNGTSTHTTLRAHMLITAAELADIPTGTNIQGIGFLLNVGCDTIANGNIQIYLQNTTDATNLKSTTWSTAITGMTSVYNGTFTIPDSAGPIDMNTTSPFIYTGGALYVAYDYAGANFATSTAIYLCNYTMPSSIKVGSSSTTTPPTTLTASSAFRPEIRFKVPNPFTNNMVLEGAYATYGSPNKFLHFSQDLKVHLKNSSALALTNVPVSLTVTGANATTLTQTIPSIAPGASTVLTFLNLSTANAGTQQVRVTIPVDQSPLGDTVAFTQEINCSDVGEGYSGVPNDGLGFNAGEGILANMIYFDPTQSVYIKKVKPMITGSTTIGHNIKGVVLDAAGNIIDSSQVYTVTAADIDAMVSLEMIGGNTDYAGDTVYYGFRQIAGSGGYYPLGMKYITGIIPPGLCCSFDTYGGGYNNYTNFGMFIIEAEITPVDYALTPSVTGTICSGSSVDLTATTGLASYQFHIDGSSVQSGANNVYSFIPSANFTAAVTSMFGSCPLSDTLMMTVAPNIVDSIDAAICQNGSYNFNGTTLTAAGVYTDTMMSQAGCDSIQVLSLSVLPVSNNAISASICDGGTFDFNGTTLSSSGVYIDTLMNQGGCDSIVELTLTVSPVYDTIVSAVICNGESYDFNGTMLTTSGLYYDTLMSAAGCDSVMGVVLNVTVLDVSITENASQTVLTSNQAGANYIWLDCATNQPIGETSQSLSASDVGPGDYKVVVTDGTCSDTSDCKTLIAPDGVNDLGISSKISIYPNPTQDRFTISSADDLITSYIIMDALGRVVQSENNITPSLKWNIDAGRLGSGTYIIRVFSDSKSMSQSLMIR